MRYANCILGLSVVIFAVLWAHVLIAGPTGVTVVWTYDTDS